MGAGAMFRAVLLGLLPAAAAGAGEDLLKRWDNPPRVTIQASKIRVEEAVERIRKATGQGVTVGANGRQAIELDLKDQTFFQALEEVAQRAGLVVTGTPGTVGEDGEGGSSLRLDRMPEEMKRVPPVVSGPVRISLLGIFAHRSAAKLFSPEATAADDTPRRLWVEMRVLVEAGLEDAMLTEVRVENAPDDADRNLAGAKSVVKDAAPGAKLLVELEAAEGGALMVRAMSGRAVFLVPEETAVLKFGTGARNATRKLGEAKFTFKKLDRKGEDGRPELVVMLEGSPCPELAREDSWGAVRVVTRAWGGFREAPALVGIYLYDKSDNPIGASTSYLRSMVDGDRASRFTLDDVPARIEVRAITKVQKREITFRFAELPIPR